MSGELVLLIEDEPTTREVLRFTFAKDGYRLLFADTAGEGLSLFYTHQPEVVICDVILPDKSGIDICREIKHTHPFTQFIFLSSLKEEIDKVLGLEIGADDFVTKPFHDRELRARVHSAIRRYQLYRQLLDRIAALEPAAPKALQLGGLRIDKTSGQAWQDDYPLDLTRKEFELLSHFADHSGKLFSRQELMLLLGNDSAEISERSVDGHISRLRDKLRVGRGSAVIETLRGRGYRFRLT